MPPDLTTHSTVKAALQLFPGAVVMPNTGCGWCAACQLITANGVGVVTVHDPKCPWIASGMSR